MVLLGLSILVASITFLCYKHPPSTWLSLRSLRLPSIQGTAAPRDKSETTTSLLDSHGPATISAKEQTSIEKEEGVVPTTIVDADTDRKAMPPPTFTLHEPIISEPKDSNRPTTLATNREDLERKAMPPPTLARGITPVASPSKYALDGKAMPPPPLFKKSTPPSPGTYDAKTVPTPAHSTVGEDLESEPEPAAPSFPLMNSAQRASGGVGGPPRLNRIPTPMPGATGGLMAPPSRAPNPLPNRGPAGLAPPPTHNAIPAKPRKKVLLTPGHSPLDWARISSSPSANLTGLPCGTPYLKVPPSLLKQMTGRKGKDAWTVLGGKVYNITPYIPYHPGGEPELMKCAGRDGTRLFGEVHPWVNWEGMLEGCLVGLAVEEGAVKPQSTLDEMD